ncbi:MAG: radical SAM-associated putative lipoprotein [Bacteroidota bacterium]
MKKVKTGLIKTYDKLIMAFLGFMGLATQCVPVAEYGMPHADYHFRGNITGRTGQQPIENIEVKVFESDTNLLGQCRTDANGDYTIDLQGMMTFDYQFRITAADTDGSENGLFTDKDTTITVDIEDLTGGDGNWYNGEMDIITDIELDESNQ